MSGDDKCITHCGGANDPHPGCKAHGPIVDVHPETFCDECGAANIMPWYVASDRWRIALSDVDDDRDHIWCPTCFVRHWESATGLVATWRLEPVIDSIRDAGHDAWMANLARNLSDYVGDPRDDRSPGSDGPG